MAPTKKSRKSDSKPSAVVTRRGNKGKKETVGRTRQTTRKILKIKYNFISILPTFFLSSQK
jgi:hypothetical protein